MTAGWRRIGSLEGREPDHRPAEGRAVPGVDGSAVPASLSGQRELLIVRRILLALAGRVPDLAMTPLEFTAVAFAISLAAGVLGSLLGLGGGIVVVPASPSSSTSTSATPSARRSWR